MTKRNNQNLKYRKCKEFKFVLTLTAADSATELVILLMMSWLFWSNLRETNTTQPDWANLVAQSRKLLNRISLSLRAQNLRRLKALPMDNYLLLVSPGEFLLLVLSAPLWFFPPTLDPGCRFYLRAWRWPPSHLQPPPSSNWRLWDIFHWLMRSAINVQLIPRLNQWLG